MALTWFFVGQKPYFEQKHHFEETRRIEIRPKVAAPSFHTWTLSKVSFQSPSNVCLASSGSSGSSSRPESYLLLTFDSKWASITSLSTSTLFTFGHRVAEKVFIHPLHRLKQGWSLHRPCMLVRYQEWLSQPSQVFVLIRPWWMGHKALVSLYWLWLESYLSSALVELNGF